MRRCGVWRWGCGKSRGIVRRWMDGGCEEVTWYRTALCCTPCHGARGMCSRSVTATSTSPRGRWKRARDSHSNTSSPARFEQKAHDSLIYTSPPLPSPPISPISHVQPRHPRHLPPPPHRPIRPVPARPQARRDILCPSPPRALRGAQLQFQCPTFEEETML